MNSEFAIAVHALVFLSHKGNCQSSEKIAENVCTNSARVRKVLARLKKVNLVEPKEGLDGGYCFNHDPSTVTLTTICKAMENAPISVSWHSGDMDMDCAIASGMAGIMDTVYQKMNTACYDALDGITIADIETQLFSAKDTL